MSVKVTGLFSDIEYTPEPLYTWTTPQAETPFACPVCSGKGLVPNGFYLAVGVGHYTTSSATPEQCRSCAGKGIVWRQQ